MSRTNSFAVEVGRDHECAAQACKKCGGLAYEALADHKDAIPRVDCGLVDCVGGDGELHEQAGRRRISGFVDAVDVFWVRLGIFCVGAVAVSDGMISWRERRDLLTDSHNATGALVAGHERHLAEVADSSERREPLRAGAHPGVLNSNEYRVSVKRGNGHALKHDRSWVRDDEGPHLLRKVQHGIDSASRVSAGPCARSHRTLRVAAN